MKILVTGAAGFIGFHTCLKLSQMGYSVYGIDNLNAYYDVRLKLDRLKELGIDVQSEAFLRQIEMTSEKHPKFRFNQMDITDDNRIDHLFENENFDSVIHLAAQAGVRYSIDNPKVYAQSNLIGYLNILEACRSNKTKLIYASSSSVYGNRDKVPFKELDRVDHPVSLYAATKKSNELMAHTYSHLYGMTTIGLRFFTVYGPWGRPDMAPFLFTRAILNGNPIKVFNQGKLKRDFTYIDDIVNGIVGIVNKNVVEGTYKIFNIGNGSPEKLNDFISLIELHSGRKAIKEMYPMQDGDVLQTFASTDELKKFSNYTPSTSLSSGLESFISWFKSYYKYQ